MPNETELKFLIDDHNIAIVPEIGQDLAKAKPLHIDTIYYDTPDWELEQAGLAVRLRKQHGKTVLSIKSIGSDPISRTEREIEISADWPTDTEWTEVAAGTLLKQRDVRGRIEPRFMTMVDRATVKIKRQRSLLAVSADRGLLKASGQCDLPINELELELISGDLKSLLNLGDRISMTAPVRLSLISKGTRGALLARGRWAHPYSGTLPKLSPDPGIAAAFKAICKTCLRDFMINEEAIKGPDPKVGVHESRIAIRRLRSALSLFKRDIDDSQLKPLAQHIKVLSDLLGQARDLDVVMEESTTWPKHNKYICALIEQVGQSQTNARRDLRNALGSEGHRRFAFDFVKWLEEGTWIQGNGKLKEPVMVEGSNLLKIQLAKLVRHGKQLKHRQNPELHEVRKDAKKLRYMSEFFASLLSDELVFE
jgi:inorganic triphosphatase YgiF